MPTHDLQYERARVRVRSRVDVVNGLADPVQRGGRADGEVCHRHVVVDGPNQSDYLEMRMMLCLIFRD